MAKTTRRKTRRAGAPAAVTIETLLSLLAGDVRRHILLHLVEGPREVTALAEAIGVEISVVSHNLRRLRESGLVEHESVSRQRIYRLGPPIAVRRRSGKLSMSFDAQDGDSLSMTFGSYRPAERATEAGR